MKKDKTEESAPTPTSTVEMKCLINGSNKTFVNPIVFETVGHTIYGGDSISFVNFNLFISATIGSYYIRPWDGQTVPHPYGFYNSNPIDSGLVTITDTTGHKIKGTFSFKCGSDRATEGTFQNLTLP